MSDPGITVEIGPTLMSLAPHFELPDHKKQLQTVETLSGPNGLILGFTRDIWLPASVRRILWLVHNARSFSRMGYGVGLIICNPAHSLAGFQMTSAPEGDFVLLADAEKQAYRSYGMLIYSGLVLIDSHQLVREKWLIPEERVWPKPQEVFAAIQNIEQGMVPNPRLNATDGRAS
jgi:peroxiredoxin